MKALTSTFTIILMLGLSGCRAQDRTTEAGEAAIQDPKVECSPYSYPPLSAHRTSFPESWKAAKILPGDTVAQDRWTSIVPSVPNIPPKPAPGATKPHYGAEDRDCWWTATGCVTPKLAGLPPDIADVPEPSTLGYGFDDGPNCSHNAFYDYLATKNQKATMFFIGSNVMDLPLETQRAITDGHEICVHTWSHSAMTSLSSPDAFAELYYSKYVPSNEAHGALMATDTKPQVFIHRARHLCLSEAQIQIIKLVAGVTPTCWRPPYGDVDDRIRAIANGMGLRTIIWNFDSNDWKFGGGATAKSQIDANYQDLVDKASSGSFSSNGAILLAHELNNFTMQEAMDYYDRLKGAFKYIVPVAVALNKTQPYAETNITMPTFEQYINGMTTVSSGGHAEVAPTHADEPTQPQPSGYNAAASSLPLMDILTAITTISLYMLSC